MFEGKIINFYNTLGEYRRAKVVACVKDVGITIVKENDPNYYCYCLRMKHAPNFSKEKGQITHTRKIFTEIRKMILAGIVDLRKIHRHVCPGFATSSTCPFNQ